MTLQQKNCINILHCLWWSVIHYTLHPHQEQLRSDW